MEENTYVSISFIRVFYVKNIQRKVINENLVFIWYVLDPKDSGDLIREKLKFDPMIRLDSSVG